MTSLKVEVKKFDRSQLRFTSVRQDVAEKTCRDSMGLPMWVVPKSVTYTVETDGEWGFDWYGIKGKFYKFNRG